MRVKLMLETEIAAMQSKNIYFGQGKVGDDSIESVYIQVLSGAIDNIQGGLKVEEEEDPLDITGFLLADYTINSSAGVGDILLVPTDGLAYLTIVAADDDTTVRIKAIG